MKEDKGLSPTKFCHRDDNPSRRWKFITNGQVHHEENNSSQGWKLITKMNINHEVENKMKIGH